MTNEIRLREIVEDDLPTLFEQQSDPDANHLVASQARSREAFLEHWAKVLHNGAVIKKWYYRVRKVNSSSGAICP